MDITNYAEKLPALYETINDWIFQMFAVYYYLNKVQTRDRIATISTRTCILDYEFQHQLFVTKSKRIIKPSILKSTKNEPKIKQHDESD